MRMLELKQDGNQTIYVNVDSVVALRDVAGKCEVWVSEGVPFSVLSTSADILHTMDNIYGCSVTAKGPDEKGIKRNSTQFAGK